MKKGPHTNPDKLRGGQPCRPTLQTQRLRVITQDGLNIKIPNSKRVMAGSHILGQ